MRLITGIDDECCGQCGYPLQYGQHRQIADDPDGIIVVGTSYCSIPIEYTDSAVIERLRVDKESHDKE